MTDTISIVRSVSALMKKSGQPLTDTQEILLAGSLAVWIEKVREDAADEARDNIGGPVCGVIGSNLDRPIHRGWLL